MKVSYRVFKSENGCQRGFDDWPDQPAASQDARLFVGSNRARLARVYEVKTTGSNSTLHLKETWEIPKP
jgi:hypothetical protein